MVNSNLTTLALSINALAIDITVIGNTRTHSLNDLVTDSAAAGTALATGHKTDNWVVGLLPHGTLVGFIMEAAKLAGYLTGLIVTSPISYATPACGTLLFTLFLSPPPTMVSILFARRESQ